MKKLTINLISGLTLLESCQATKINNISNFILNKINKFKILIYLNKFFILKMRSNPRGEKDDRFKKIATDPKFKEIPKKIRKVEVKDSRFTSMFTNKSFNEGLEFDIYGRKHDKSQNNNKKELERYYMVEDAEENYQQDAEDEHISQGEISEGKIPEDDISGGIKDGEMDVEEEAQEAEEAEEGGLPDGEYESDTSEEFEQFLQERTNQTVEDPFEEIEQKNIPTGDETKRISVMNIDWENMRAVDLYVLFSSFCKGKAKVEKVEIYPSEFGIKEMERERREGPSKEIFEEVKPTKKNKKSQRKESEDSKLSNASDEHRQIIHTLDEAIDDQDNNQEGVNPLKLRKYELRKLRYYYAIVYCNTKEAALEIYNECDGMEIEKTQNFMDLRFVPDELVEFPYSAKEVCNKIPAEYNPKFHSNSALQHSNVKLTWESNDPKRNELIAKAFSKEQFNQEDIQQLLMSSDSETDEDAKLFAEELLNGTKSDDENELNLLKRKKNKELNIKEGETIEITFNKGFEGVNQNISINKTGAKDKSMWENYLDKKKNIRREKKQDEKKKREDKKDKRIKKDDNPAAKKKELNLLVDNSLQNKSFKYNNSDDRFTAISKDTKYAVDPTSKEFKNKKK